MVLHEVASEDPDDIIRLVSHGRTGDRGGSGVHTTVRPQTRQGRRVHLSIPIIILIVVEVLLLLVMSELLVRLLVHGGLFLRSGRQAEVLEVDVPDEVVHAGERRPAFGPHASVLLGGRGLVLLLDGGPRHLRLRPRAGIGLKICDRASG